MHKEDGEAPWVLRLLWGDFLPVVLDDPTLLLGEATEHVCGPSTREDLDERRLGDVILERSEIAHSWAGLSTLQVLPDELLAAASKLTSAAGEFTRSTTSSS